MTEAHTTKEIKLIGGKMAIVDQCDFDRVNAHVWYGRLLNGIWYAIAKINKKMIPMQQIRYNGN